MPPLRILHLADLHLGFTGPSHLLVPEGPQAGRPLREVDVEAAAQWIVAEARTLLPAADLVLIAGDLFHRASPLPRAVAAAAGLIAGLRELGTEVIIIDGNHDTPGRVIHGSALAFLEALGATVVTAAARTIDGASWLKPALQNVVVCALPASADPEEQLSLHPVPGKINLLLAHGRPSTLGETWGGRGATPLAPELLRREWTYAALGDWHAHGHQPLREVPAFYPGSLEALNFGEARHHPAVDDDPYAQGGMLLVDVVDGHATVERRTYPDRRPVLRLNTIDARQQAGHAVLEQLERQLEDIPAQALVTIRVCHCPPELYPALDRLRLEQLKGRCAHLELLFEEVTEDMQLSQQPATEASLQEQWAEFIRATAASSEVAWLTEQGGQRLADARRDRSEQRAGSGGEV